MVEVMKLTYFAHRREISSPICNEEVHRQAKNATFYVFTWLKVGGPSIAAAHEGQKVGGPWPAPPNSFRCLWSHSFKLHLLVCLHC